MTAVQQSDSVIQVFIFFHFPFHYGSSKYIESSPLAYTATAAAKSLQLCPNLCHPMDSSPSFSPGPGILQARTLEWVAISFSNA